MSRVRRSERGATFIEFAFVAPALLLLMIAMCDIGLVVIGNSVGSNAAREGARRGLIDFACGDAWSGSTSYDAAACTAPSANFHSIEQAVRARLAGLVRGAPVVRVACLDGAETARVIKPCTMAAVVPSRDLIEVTVEWRHIGVSPFVVASSHQDVARMLINGKPQLSPAGSA